MNKRMVSRASQPSKWSWASPWVILGMVCILGGILIILAFKNLHREREFMEQALLSEANVLMNSLEASSRMSGWGQRQTQFLLEQTAQQPGVLYVALVAPTGQVIADSDPNRVGMILPFQEPQPGEVLHRFSDQSGRTSFDVIRSFKPRSGHRASRRVMQSEEDLFIVVGLDPLPFEQAMSQDLHQTILLFSIMFLVGAGGFISLVWASHYRQARRSLRDVQVFTTTIVNQMPVGMIATDQNGRIQQINSAAKSILGFQEDSLGSLQDLPGLAPILQELESEETVLEEEIQCGLDGDICIPLLVNASVIRDAERGVAGYVFLFTDMTNIKELEEQLRRSERLASLGRLAAGVAHEIRNPLGSIKGFATILAGRSQQDERSLEITRVMKDEVDRLNRVVTELLEFARPTEIEKRLYPCRQILEHTLQLVKSDAEHQSVVIEWQVVPDDLEAALDLDRFSQLLLNLYLNALHAMEQGGALKVQAHLESDAVVFSVEDTGVGIEADDLPHIFDPYFTTKARGVGLGLANAHKIVEAHGGTITVSSNPGEGATFVVRLPL
ncbi:MAG: ATP-binding protein [Desulfoferrobacter sp.]